LKVVAVLQARTGSTRLPGKVLLPLGGRPALERMLERLAWAKELDDLIVATTREATDDSLLALCERLGVPCYRGSSQDLLDRHLRAARLLAAEAIVKIPSDCPLIDPAVVDQVVAQWRLRADELDYLSNLHPETFPDGNDVEIMSATALAVAHREATRPYEREHTTPFLWDQPERFRLGNVGPDTALPTPRGYRLTLDYPEDYEVISRVFDGLFRSHQPSSSPIFGLDAIAAFFERNPEVAELNARHRGVHWYRHHLTELRTIDAASFGVSPQVAGASQVNR